MLPFDFRHVMKLHVLSNDEYQVHQSGQTRVASQQTDGPRTKLGYDTSDAGFTKDGLNKLHLFVAKE